MQSGKSIRLSKKEQCALDFRNQGFDYRDIAIMLGALPSTVRGMVSRAKTKIAQQQLVANEIHRELGAFFPTDKAWQRGKTAASIDFVNKATEYLETCNNDNDRALLINAIEKIKKGEVVETSFALTSVADFLKQENQRVTSDKD